MRVVFRVDSSFMIGTGHVMRCLTLAHAFSRHGWQVGFICRDLPGNINYLIGSQKFNVYSLPAAHPRIAKEGYAQWLGVETVVDCSQTK
jgi:UDP-2,4-diacetamido-2,4,6-trideoxy-beta-L-altropyranose hydrolase